MPRSTPGTRFRRRLVMDLQAARSDLDRVTRAWKPAGTVYTEVTENGRVVDARPRPRLDREYPENQAATIARSHQILTDTIATLNRQRGELARRYREVLAKQQKEVQP